MSPKLFQNHTNSYEATDKLLFNHISKTNCNPPNLTGDKGGDYLQNIIYTQKLHIEIPQILFKSFQKIYEITPLLNIVSHCRKYNKSPKTPQIQVQKINKLEENIGSSFSYSTSKAP